MLKRIINPDGTTDFNIDRLKQQYTNKYVNNVFTNEVFLKYFYETLQNEDEIPFSSKIGRIMQQTTQPGEANRYAFFFSLEAEGNNEPFLFDTALPIDENLRTKLEEFIGFHDLFYCSFRTPSFTAKNEPIFHVFILKKDEEAKAENENMLNLIDPHGTDFGSPQSAFNQQQKQDLGNIFRDFNIDSSRCPFQGKLGVCLLWSLLFLNFPEKSAEDIQEMVKSTAEFLQLKPTQENYDYIVIAIFEKFLFEGFARPEEIEQYHPGEKIGLGKSRKCKKCGLPKA